MAKTLQDADRDARKHVNTWTTVAAGTGWLPGSSIFLTGADMAMITQVANAYEVNDFDIDHLKALLGGAIGGVVAGNVIAEVTGLIPLVGWAAKSAGMAAKAKTIGDAVINYFRERSDLPDVRVSIPLESSDGEKPKNAPKQKTDIAVEDEEA
ncbi:MAG: hypothetical protein OXG49_14280 [Chloroflexi bacterium]|nr:hypothetical protein [Chloroflexota bacterium]